MKRITEIDYDRIFSEDISTLENLQKIRVSMINENVKFKKELDKILNNKLTISGNLHQDIINDLREYVFYSKGNKTIKTFSNSELSIIFAQFGVLSSPKSQIELYETCDNKEFCNAKDNKMFYAQALIRCERICDAITEFKKLLFKYSSEEHGEINNYLGDAYLKQWRVAIEISEILSNLKDNYSEKLPLLLKKFYSHFSSKTQHFNPKDITIDLLNQLAKKAKNNAIKAYNAHFNISCSHEPILRILNLLSYERSSITKRLEEIEQEKINLINKKQELDNRINLQSELAKLSISSQGDETRNYWVHSGNLEALGYSNIDDIEQYKPSIARLCLFAKGPHQFNTTILRLEYIKEFNRIENKKSMINIIDIIIKLINEAKKRLTTKGSGDINDLLTINETNRAISMKETQRIKNLTNSNIKTSQLFIRRSFNMRGMVESPLPFFIPGGLSIVGGRVPDLVFSQADRPIFKTLIHRWLLDTIDNTDSILFCDTLIDYIRDIYQTHKLQDLHSDEHKRFDIASDACISLVGIPPEKRKGTDCSTNCSAALLLMGDCREHATEMCAFFDYWQKLNINTILKNNYKLLQNHKTFNITQVKEQVDNILADELRACHIGIYSFVRMENKYEHEGWKESKPKLYRSYGKENILKQEKLSEYELQHSFLLIYFGNNKDDVFIIEPKWDDNKNKMQLPNNNGIPYIENIDMMEKIELYNLVEEHTMTFLMRLEKDGQVILQCKDAFYNENYNKQNTPETEHSPYNFGKQILNLNELDSHGSMYVGNWDIFYKEENKSISVPIRIKLLPFSKRTDKPSLQKTNKLHFMGLILNYADVVTELSREKQQRKLGEKSRRDKFLDKLYELGKKQQKS